MVVDLEVVEMGVDSLNVMIVGYFGHKLECCCCFIFTFGFIGVD
jgi:hypothetical protein